MNATKATRHNTAMAGAIPTELWTNLPLATRILNMVVRRVWSRENPPILWLEAVLCVLYKGKGNKADPNSFRGISLLSGAEKVLSLMVPRREHLYQQYIRPWLPSHARVQSGSCGSRYIRPWLPSPHSCVTFVDFSKAFDSIHWTTEAVRLSAEGLMSPTFQQVRGMRQGCSLSPAVFVLVSDRAMQPYTVACQRLGLDADA